MRESGDLLRCESLTLFRVRRAWCFCLQKYGCSAYALQPFFVVAAGMEIPPLHGTDGGHNI